MCRLNKHAPCKRLDTELKRSNLCLHQAIALYAVMRNYGESQIPWVFAHYGKNGYLLIANIFETQH